MNIKYPNSLEEMAALYEQRDPYIEISELRENIEIYKSIQDCLDSIVAKFLWERGNDVY